MLTTINNIPMKREQSNVSHFLAAILDILDSSDTSLPEINHTWLPADHHRYKILIANSTATK